MSKSAHLSIRLEPAEKKALDRLAAEADIPVAQLIRRAIKRVAAEVLPLGEPEVHVRQEGQPSPTRERELVWLRENAGALRELEGQYLVIEGDRLVAHGTDYRQVIREARARGVRIPCVVRVPESEPGFFAGL